MTQPTLLTQKPETREITFKIPGVPVPNNDKQNIMFPKKEVIRGLFWDYRIRVRSFDDCLAIMKKKMWIHRYKPSEVEAWKESIQLQSQRFVPRGNDEFLVSLPVEIFLEFILPKPKSVKREIMCVKPDWDNLSKVAGDGLQAAGFFKNDSQIYRAHVGKIYDTVAGEEPGLAVRVKYYLS